MAVRRTASNPIGDFLTFRWMITPVLIQAFFYLGTLVCLIWGGRVMLSSFDSRVDPVREYDRTITGKEKTLNTLTSKFAVMEFAGGLMIVVMGPLILRIVCELDIILFKIHDELKSANDRARYRSDG